ncbi:MAG: trypco2 family protein [Candidatus Bathyarchaeia archaeon]
MQTEALGIYELAKAVREEIKKIREDKDFQEKPFIYLDSLDLELNVVVSEAAKGGIKFYIVSVGGEYEKERISRIKLSFKPILSQEELEALRKSGAVFLTMKPQNIYLFTKLPSPRTKKHQ